jgi:hypothetical protein
MKMLRAKIQKMFGEDKDEK